MHTPEKPRKTSLPEKLLNFFFYPFYFIFTNVFDHRKSVVKRFFLLVFSFLILFPIWLIEMGATALAIWTVLQVTGLAYVRVPVQGASMLPTLPTEGHVEFKRYPQIEALKPAIQRGDLVVFENAKTDEELKKEGKDASGFVKRVVGVAGDTVLMRDGFVYVNDSLVREPYILKPRSTFGGDEIKDCQAIQVPSNQIFVLGDNRKVSMDSRQIGLVNLTDLDFYRPLNDQKEFEPKWRDASGDEKTALSSLFNIDEYLRLLNIQRTQNKLPLLKHQPKLDQSARLRAQAMLQYDDLSFEATKSAYPMEKALKEVGYSNITYGEFPMLGYYDAQELYESFFEHANTKEFLLNKDYQEIGVSAFVGDLHGCPVQIVVQHLGGYIPPNYKQDTINSWKDLVQKLKDVQPSWQNLKNREDFYKNNKENVDKINDIIALRISHAQAIVTRMEANEWLTEDEKNYTFDDEKLQTQQSELADKINTAVDNFR